MSDKQTYFVYDSSLEESWKCFLFDLEYEGYDVEDVREGHLYTHRYIDGQHIYEVDLNVRERLH